MQAADVRRVGEIQAAQAEARGRQTQAGALAALGVSGVETTTGSAAAAMESIAFEAATDAARARAAAARHAWGFEFEARQRETAAERTRRLGILGEKVALVGGAAQIAGQAAAAYGRGG